MIFRWIARAAALLTLSALLAVAAGALVSDHSRAQDQAGAATAGVVIPDFWDPRRRVERPPPGTVPAIRFITTDDFPPFNFLDAQGHLAGFNVDLARAICVELTIQCTIQARQWSELEPRLADKTADAAIAGIAITAEARAALDFSDVYLRTPGRFLVRKADAGLALTSAGLSGKTIAVVGKTAHEAYLAAMFPEVSRRVYPTADAAREAVKRGEVDAHFGDGLQLSFWLQSQAAEGCCVFAGGPYLESRFFGQGYAIAVAKGSNDLKRALNAAMQSLYEKGTYAELYLRYFPVGFF
ncbi:MAG TPA: transporter substrate-binding domain-containing protein [Bauldia sp.]|nr:transporter substrate-binding domain-containing protein [Bauldia sp.]